MLASSYTVFSAAEEYLFDFYNFRNYFWQYLGIILGIIGE